MKLCRLLYISDAARKMSRWEVSRLVEKSSVKNESRGITGLLLYSGGHFMQILEGEPRVVTSLFDQISSDPRHTNHRILAQKEASYRLFPEWGMQLVTTDRSQPLDRDRIDKTLLRLRMSSSETEATEAIALLEEFRAQFVAGAAI